MRILKALGSSAIVICTTVGLVGLPISHEGSIKAATISSSAVLASAQTASTTVKLIVDDELIAADVPPKLHQGRVMIPIRMVSEALGSRVGWDNKNKIITVDTDFSPKKSGNDIQIWIKGKLQPKDTPILVDQGRILVPARLMAEALGASVEWVSKEQAVYVRFNTTKGHNEWEAININLLSSLQMLPVGWGFSRSIGPPPSDSTQKQLDQTLDRLLTVIKQSKRIDPIELKQPIRRVYANVESYMDADGNKQYGGGLELTISGSYAKLVWANTLARPVYLQISEDRLKTILNKVEELLPASFPTLKTKTTPLQRAVIQSDVVRTVLVAEEVLPFMYSMELFKDPMSGDLAILQHQYEDGQLKPNLMTSKDGIVWESQKMKEYGKLIPSTIGILNDDPATLLVTNSLDSSMYRAEWNKKAGELKWERVWEYPWPEANDKYAPVRFIPDPIEGNRVYTAFFHDTRFYSTKGLFMSEDSGLSWFESGINGKSDIQFLFPEAAIPDPYQAETVYMNAALTMEQKNLMNYYSSNASFMSKDAGRNWIQLHGIDKIFAVSKAKDGSLITAARHDAYTSSLLTSNDYGSTWKERKLPFKISDLKVDPGNPRVLLATAFSTPRTSATTYYSSDGGATWKPIELKKPYIIQWLPEQNLIYVHGERNSIDAHRLEL